MIRVVLDTNVIVSALLKDEGNEAAVLLLALQGTLQFYVSEPILTEYDEVLHRKKFSFDPNRVRHMLALIRQAATVVDPLGILTVSPHEPDNRLLECAQQSRADYLVTGNKRHFPKRWKATRTVNAKELLDLLGPEAG
jgi:putative PIN family toxin of toxin-antitoxin system